METVVEQPASPQREAIDVSLVAVPGRLDQVEAIVGEVTRIVGFEPVERFRIWAALADVLQSVATAELIGRSQYRVRAHTDKGDFAIEIGADQPRRETTGLHPVDDDRIASIASAVMDSVEVGSDGEGGILRLVKAKPRG